MWPESGPPRQPTRRLAPELQELAQVRPLALALAQVQQPVQGLEQLGQEPVQLPRRDEHRQP
jgi:hypothetical protein